MQQKQINLKNKYLLGLSLLSSVLFFAGTPFAALALEFRSIAPAKAILYDAPSVEASKLYILGQGYPVEVIVNLGEWIKIRDANGGLSWVEGKQLSNKRMVLLITKSDIKSSADPASSLVGSVEKDVVLELLTTSAKTGWVKVKHRDGLTGFVPSSALWGLN